MAPSIFPQAEEDGSLADNLIELARTGQIEFVDVLLDETRADWELVEPDVLAWLSRLESQGTADEKRNACGVAMMLADRKGFRPNALPEEAEDSLRILEKASLALGASLPPLPRARLTLALAAAYSDRAAGDRERNQKVALQLVESALFLIDARTHPELLGRAHKLLGTIHRKRGAGSRRDHSEAAIGAFRAALRVFSPTGQPELWASVQLDLGNTLRQRHAGDRNENNEQAIEAFTAGLRVLSREQSPLDWGLLKLALGQALLERDVADRTATLERAISTLHEAEEALPASAPEYATTQYRLGLAYQRRKTGDRLDNLQRAAEHYARSLPGLSPEERRSAEENLDAARQELRRKQR
jgi:tetratricopeptide (TPR) repeat protein